MENIVNTCNRFATACGLSAAVLDYSTRCFLPEAQAGFCPGCPMAGAGHCCHTTAHLYGSFEAERWNGLYIYYCPLSLTFISTTVYSGSRAAYALVCGPVLMGSPEDLFPEGAGLSADMLGQLPRRTAVQVNAVAQTQRAVSQYLSGSGANKDLEMEKAGSELLNSLYDLSASLQGSIRAQYPLELEQRLQLMIRRGDKQGARELINELLGRLYFSSGGNLEAIKQRAKELIVLFSRSSMDGGADARQIFGQLENTLRGIDSFASLEELSVFLTQIFYRFVGYVFDFGRFEHSNILHKTVNFVRENYAEKISLEDVAEHVGLSRSYLSTVIKDELGMPFTDYVNLTRIEKSRELLLNPGLTIADIAGLVGYSDQSYFTKVFARVVGVSPGLYRKKRGRL